MKNYQILIMLKTFQERLDYLKLDDRIFEETHSGKRTALQSFYASNEWRRVRATIVSRDKGNDMGLHGYPITKVPYVHHIVPVNYDTLVGNYQLLINPNNLITVSRHTHRIIHYGIGTSEIIIRTPNDTKLW